MYNLRRGPPDDERIAVETPLRKSFLSGCTRRSLAESEDTKGCICTICVVDLLMMSGLRSKHVEEFNLM